MRIDENDLREIVKKHLVINELKRSHVQSLLLELDVPGADAIKQEALKAALDSAKSWATSDSDAVDSIEFWTTIKEVLVGGLAIGGAGAFAFYAPLPIKLKLAGAAAILATGAAGIYYVSSSADKEIEKLNQQKAVQGGFDKFLIKSNPAKAIDRKARKMIKEGSLSVPYSEDDAGSSSQGYYTPPASLPAEIQTEEDAAAITTEIDNVITNIAARENNRNAEGNIRPDNFLGISLSEIEESGIDSAKIEATALSIVDRIIDMENQDADQNVKAIFGDLCQHPVCEWDSIDKEVGEIFLRNMGKVDFTTFSDEEDANWTYGSKGEDVGILFGDNDIMGYEHIEYLASELKAHTNNRTKSVIYQCLIRYDMNYDQYNDAQISELAKVAIDDNLPGGLINNFIGIEDNGNKIVPNYETLTGDDVLGSASNRGDRTYFGPEFLTKLSVAAKKSGGISADEITKKAKQKIGEILDDTIGLTGDLRSKLMGMIPALVGGALGAGTGYIAGGWIGAVIGGLLGAVTGYYIFDLYDYFFGEDGIFSGGSGGSDDKDKEGGGGSSKKPVNPEPLPGRLQGISRTAGARVKQIEGIVNEYNGYYQLTDEIIPADDKWEGGGTGKTDAVWRNPFIKHVFANDPDMKEKAFADRVTSGELWVWRALSRELIGEYPLFSPDTAGCLAFCQFVYGNILTSNIDAIDDNKKDDKESGDGSSKDIVSKFKSSGPYSGLEEIEIGFNLTSGYKRPNKLSNEEEKFFDKVEDASFLEDIDSNLAERIKITLIRSMKSNIILTGDDGHFVKKDETYNVTFSNDKGKVKKIKSQRFLKGRFEDPKGEIRDVVSTQAEDRLQKVLKNAELSITFKGPGQFRVPQKINEDTLRKVIKVLIESKNRKK